MTIEVFAHDPTVQCWRPTGRDQLFENDGEACTDDKVWDEVWTENVYRLRPEMLQGGMVIDAGANIGAFTALVLAMNPEQRVVAIEPDDENRELLAITLDGNNWRHRALKIGAALMPYTGTTMLEGAGPTAQVGISGACVRTVEFEHVVGTQEIDFLKVDIESSEYEVWRPGAAAWDKMPQIRWMAMEWHKTEPWVFGAFLGSLSETHCFDVIGRPETGGMLWAHRHDL